MAAKRAGTKNRVLSEGPISALYIVASLGDQKGPWVHGGRRNGSSTCQDIAKGKTEHAAINADIPNRTFFAEAAVVADTIAILREVESTLDWELTRTARSSNLAMPEQG